MASNAPLQGGIVTVYSGSFNASGERFGAVYRIAGSKNEARKRAEAITIEQTIEFPADLVDGPIRAHILGRIEAFDEVGPERFDAEVSYAVETAGNELTQLLNVFFGNTSLIPGIRLMSILLSPTLTEWFPGPRFGISGMREWLGVPHGPLLSTALKPMGLSPDELADMAYKLSLGGLHIIKDDHGLADQTFSSYAARIEKVTRAIGQAAEESGHKAVYVPNVTATGEESLRRARLAKEAGVGAVMVAPGLVGFDRMEQLAREVGLPVLSHPAFLGGFVSSRTGGIDHYVLFGQLQRLAGADMVIFPNFGGRFSFSREECSRIVEGTKSTALGLKGVFPVPGGGMTLARVPEMLSFYGDDIVFLIGGDLHRGASDLIARARRFKLAVVSEG